MKTTIGLMLSAVLTLALGLAGPAWGEQCESALPRCIDVITLTEQKVSFQNQCSYKVAIRVEVINGFGGGIAQTNPGGAVFVYDENFKHPNKPGVEPVYSQELKCCTHLDGYRCIDLF